MSWQTRNRRAYYYSATRYGRRVVNLYMGASEVASAAFTLERLDREKREDRRYAARREREEREAQEQQFADFCAKVEELRQAALYAAGYHRHHQGEWRKRRAGTVASTAGAKYDGAFSNIPTAKLTEDDPEQRKAILRRAENGDEAAVPAVQRILAARVRPLVDLAESLQQSYVGHMSKGGNLVVREGIFDQLSRLRQELTGGVDPSPLERLLIERIVACWLALQYQEHAYSVCLTGQTLAQDANWQNRLDKSQRRYLAAIKALAQVRRLQLPVIMLNMAQNQVNVGAQQMNAGARQVNAGNAQINTGGGQ
jgi:X-X-X-Leu-X-X-Gly heptad repeat protein